MGEKEQINTTKNNISGKVIKGGAWMYGRMLVTNIVNLLVMIILARQLSPAVFGLVALANVIMRLLNVVISQGSNQYIIYDNKEGREKRVQAAFWIDIIFACICSLVGILLTPFITRFYQEPGLGGILLALFIKFPLDALSLTPDALIKKSLNFKKLELRDTVLEIMSGILSVLMALRGYGVWSLVVPGLIMSFFRFIIIFRISDWRPGFNFYFNEWKTILKYSSYVIGNSLVTFVISEGDTLLIGKIMGSYTLGVYNLAWQSANIVCRTVVNMSNKLALPALAGVSHDEGKLRDGMNKMLKFLSIVSFPLLIGLLVVAEDFILAVYGAQWKEAILPLQIMIIYALRYAIGAPVGNIFRVIGRPDIIFKVGIVTVPFYLISIWFGSYWGIIGVAVAVTLVRTIFGFVGFYYAAKYTGQSMLDLLKPLAPSLEISLITGVIIYVAKMVACNTGSLHSLVNLCVLSLIGGIAFLLLLRAGRYRSLAVELGNISAPLLGKRHFYIAKILNINH